jgi:enamine deaminase RidA (YjgF/YER057c/UK114 family)
LATALAPAELARASRPFNYSPGVLVTGGRLVICSGQVGLGPDGRAIADPEEQYAAAFDNVGRVLAEAGAGFGDLVELVTFHTSFDGFDLFRAVKDRYVLGPVYPTWTGVAVSALAVAGLLVEIKATAAVA